MSRTHNGHGRQVGTFDWPGRPEGMRREPDQPIRTAEGCCWGMWDGEDDENKNAACATPPGFSRTTMTLCRPVTGAHFCGLSRAESFNSGGSVPAIGVVRIQA